MKIKIGIVGYGNLGKAVEKQVLANPNFELVAIFSRRLIKSNFNTKIEPFENYVLFKNKIDIMMLCGSSKNDIINQSIELSRYFNTINSFDTHSKIPSLLSKLNETAILSKKIAITSCGWDPGLFSLIRTLTYAIGNSEPITFWGKGISMGHSDAIRQIDGVDDGIEFTIPNKTALKLAKLGKIDESIPKHLRECYVVCKNKKLEPKIEFEIKNIPNYFSGQPTKINFISQLELLKLKNKMSHKGEVINNFKTSSNSKCQISFKVNMSSNPDFTAMIMIAYIQAIISMLEKNTSGAFTPLDIPIIYLIPSSKREKIISNLC